MDTNIRIRHEIFFQKLAERRRLAHAYLFSGNDESQKQKIIKDFFAYANIQLADQVHIHPTNEEISIGDIRELNALLSMSAWNSFYKIAVIHSAHTMNKEAQSAFLKLLEEPKGNTVFFLFILEPKNLNFILIALL
jgi:DNA polymerase III gamma/tau subunit